MAAKHYYKTQQQTKNKQHWRRRDIARWENDGGRRGSASQSFLGRVSWIMHKKCDKIDHLIKINLFLCRMMELNKTLWRSHRRHHSQGVTERVLYGLRNPCRWTRRTASPWSGSIFALGSSISTYSHASNLREVGRCVVVFFVLS